MSSETSRPPSVQRSPEAPPQATVLVCTAASTTTHELEPGRPYVVGRSAEAAIVVEGHTVSRRHAQLVLERSGQVFIEDLGSANGSFVAGVRVAVGARALLSPGTALEVGPAILFVKRVASPDGSSGLSPPEAVPPSPAMAAVYELLETLAPTRLSILLMGETGSGKQICAEAIRRLSDRREKPFLQLNCGALPESVLVGELFGYERGAFSGAVHAKPGLFESADGGTVFLDEVGELPLAVQSTLLHVLESGDVLRIGSLTPRRVDVRFLSATNVNLRNAVAEKRFREDLFHRLNGFTVTVPPLRERPSEIVPLALEFLRGAAPTKRTLEITDSARALLLAYHWPGNVRELRRVMERAAVVARGSAIDAPTLARNDPEVFGHGTGSSSAPRSLKEVFASKGPTDIVLRASNRPGEADRARIVEALQKSAWNQTRAAKSLDMSRFALMRRMEALGIARPRQR